MEAPNLVVSHLSVLTIEGVLHYCLTLGAGQSSLIAAYPVSYVVHVAQCLSIFISHMRASFRDNKVTYEFYYVTLI